MGPGHVVRTAAGADGHAVQSPGVVLPVRGEAEAAGRGGHAAVGGGAVVGEEHDERVLVDAGGADRRQDPADAAVDAGDLGGVDGHPLRLPRLVGVGLPRRDFGRFG